MLSLLTALAFFTGTPHPLDAQERGAIALGEAVEGLGVSARVLMVGAHPDDEDTYLITWLQRGRHVETAYLSLTRGDGGQNLIGNELGEALGVIRTEELFAARRIDGARQYFTRAFDFGFSKDTLDTYKHWQRDSILGDVVRVVRAFRPHVIVAVFSGTPRDGHGHHQVSGLLARAAYDVSGDTTRFAVATHGAPWTVHKFYRAVRGNAQAGTLGVDVGEYSPLLGRSYGEIAGESRSQHKSQGFGALQRKGPIMTYVRREASRVNESAPANGEKSMFDGIDTTWMRFAPTLEVPARAALDSLVRTQAALRGQFDAYRPASLVTGLVRALRLVRRVCPRPSCSANGDPRRADLLTTTGIATQRISLALSLAAGLEVEALATRDEVSTRSPIPVVTTVYNRGSDTISAGMATIVERGTISSGFAARIAPGAAWRDSGVVVFSDVSQPWWLATPRVGAMFSRSGPFEFTAGMSSLTTLQLGRGADTVSLHVTSSVSNRVVDAVKGELERIVSGVPAVSLSLGQAAQYAPAHSTFDREFVVRVRSADDSTRQLRVTLMVPAGLSVDSATRVVPVAGFDEPIAVTFRVRGRLAAGDYRIEARAEWNGETFTRGFDLIDYDHIRRQRIYRPASIRLTAVDVKVPGTLRVAYVPGVGDNVAPVLAQLGIPVTVMAARDIARADLTRYTTVVIGPRAYEANPELLAANPKLFDFARRGGVLLVQYGQYEMTQPGAMPYPITLARPADRVTQEDSPVTIDAPNARELTSPNRIGPADFAGWVQERSLYMPRTFDDHYRALMFINDTGEAANKGGVLIAPLGDGLYIYTTLAFFRQLPAGVPGAARLFVNLLSAKLAPGVAP